jgi:transcriptional regulator with XRE-family HTH domain
MRSPQELREAILELLDERGTNPHQMLKKCGYNTSLVNDLKKGQMPSADKIANIAKFLGVSSDFLLGVNPPEDAGPADPDIALLEDLRREFYGDSKAKLKPEDRQRILDMAKIIASAKTD